MAQNTSLKDPSTEQGSNIGQVHSDDMFGSGRPLSDREREAWDDIVDQNPDMASPETVRQGEEAPTRSWENNVTPSSDSQDSSQPRHKRALGKAKVFFKKPKGILTLIGGGGFTAGLAFWMFLLPNQLTMAIENVMGAAGAVPEYAVQQRGEYLTTRYLASRILALDGNDFDSNVLFCKNGSIGCSLASTKFAEFFDKKYGLSVSSRPAGTTVTVRPQGRVALGGKAISWEIDYSRTSRLDGKMYTVTKSINSNSEMKAFIEADVDKTHQKNRLARLIAKWTLMRKHGVTQFRGPLEKQRNNITEWRKGYSAKLAANTVGKIMPKLPIYISCLQGSDSLACKQALSAATSVADKMLTDIDDELKRDDLSDGRRQDLESRRSAAVARRASVATPDYDGPLNKVMSRNLVFGASGAMFAVGMLDVMFNVVGAVDDGAIEVITHDVMSQAYIGYTYGDEIGMVINNDMMRVGANSMEVIGDLTSSLNGMAGSPLYQYRSGLIDYDPQKSYKAECDVDGERSVVTLEKGELVCPEEKMVKEIGNFRNNTYWQTIASASPYWNGSIGAIIDVAEEVVGQVIGPVLNSIFNFVSNIPPVKAISAELMSKATAWFHDNLFGVPNIGADGSGTTNYVALDGGIAKSINDTMEGGVDPNSGDLIGAGGTVLSPLQVAAINNEKLQEDREEFDSKSVLAKIFDVNLRGSMVNKLSVVIPRDVSGLLGFGPKLIGNVSNIISSDAYANTGAYNPHGFPVYGYGPGDAVFTEDPTTYDTATCEDFAQAREDSYGVHEEISALPTYAVADPCALERVVVGSILDDAGITDDENSITEADTGSTVVADGGTGSDSTDGLPAATGKIVSPIPPSAEGRVIMSARYGRYPGGSRHYGVDLAGGGDGAWVFVSACDGIVEKVDIKGDAVKNRNAYGDWKNTNYIWVKCDSGVYMGYAHFYADTLKSYITPGYRISAGTPIAPQGCQGNSKGQTVGREGIKCGPHLHFQINTNSTTGWGLSETIDPAAYLLREGVSLPRPNY